MLGCTISTAPVRAAISVTHWSCQREKNQRNTPIGTPIANTSIYILDSNMEPVPIGQEGELYIGGVQVGLGYLNRPDLTKKSFLSDPFVSDPDARLYKTGDLARHLADGNIEFLGRIDHQVKIRGYRIELGEIETVLSGHPAVAESVATVHEYGPSEPAYPRILPVESRIQWSGRQGFARTYSPGITCSHGSFGLHQSGRIPSFTHGKD